MKHNRQSGSRQGVVLIVVLVLVVMVALAGFGFLAAMSTEYEAARLNGSMLQAQQTMASAESTLNWFAALPERERLALGGCHHNPTLFRGRMVVPLSAIGSNAATVQPEIPVELPANVDLTDDRWRFSIVTMDVREDQNAVLRFGLQNESSKLHLANILRWDQAIPGHGRVALRQLPGMTDVVADSILDWMDADNQPREFGAESDYYQTLDRPYDAANAVPQRLMELLYVKGVTRRLLTGTQNADPLEVDNQSSLQAELPSTDASGEFARDPATAGLGWNHFLTMHSAERNRNRLGEPRIFLNSGSLTLLEQQLAAVLPENLVRYVLLARVYGLTPAAGSGVEPPAAPFSLSMVPAFQIESATDLIDSVVQVSSPSGTIVVHSPLQTSSPDFSTLVATLLDRVTTHPESLIHGRINISTAPETVLRSIPGMTQELASQILTQRKTLEDAQGDSLGWLLSRNVLDVAMFRKLFTEITTGGDVFQCEIVVHRAIGGPMLRRNLILDAASSPVRRVQWMDLTDTRLWYSHRMLSPPMP